jgi:long-chain acyl-CoA synthetase
LAQVTASLSQAVRATPDDRSLALLPLSTLLENVGGVYAPLYSGAQACLPDLADCGLHGSSGVDPVRVMAALDHFQPTSTILVPQLLKVIVEAAQGGGPVPGSLRFAAVGGARTAPALIERARRLSLPVYEGYGLSEAGSVVSLNLPDRDHVGSTGRALPHARVRIADDGEVLVSGTLFNGYLGRPGAAAGEWRTGDLGRLDANGYLHITGRKRSAYITAYGRNVSPDWVEGELLAASAVMQAAVFGEGRPYNVAVLVPHPRATTGTVSRAMAEANRRLPDYARVPRWVIANEVFTPANGLSRGGGVNRSAVAEAYAAEIENLYAREETDALV